MNNSTLTTTKQARSIISNRGFESIWTNKPKDETKRTMKVYGTTNDKINKALIEVIEKDLVDAGIVISKINYTFRETKRYSPKSSIRFTISV